jgi:DNA-binding transcriptional LysR family regulator
MPRKKEVRAESRPYKQLTLPLLQVFREVARAGSQAAAARRLGLAQPTVWEQMQSLERLVGTKLLQVRGRSSQLTEEGSRFLNLALPVLEGFESLTGRLLEKRGGIRRQLRVAATPRCMQEDLPPCVVEFESRFPDALLSISVYNDSSIQPQVLNREIDIGFSPVDHTPQITRELTYEMAYEVDLFLITPLGHPLASKKMVVPEDITDYPIVNAPGTFYGERMRSVEAQLIASQVPQKLAVYTVAAIRRFVKLGFGVGVVPKRSRHPADPELHERSLTKYAGRTPVFAITPRGSQNELAAEFLKVVRTVLN